MLNKAIRKFKSICMKIIENFSKKELIVKKQMPQKLTMKERVIPWFEIKGDQTLRLDYPLLNQESIVFDVGGYEGSWANDINNKYKCKIYVFEPVKEFYLKMIDKFGNHENVKIYNYGLSDKNEKSYICLDSDASSIFKSSNENEEIVLKDIKDFIETEQIQKIDLIKINIEGGEYPLLEHLIKTGLINIVENIQVQFHDFIPNAEERMKKIQNDLKFTHSLTWQYEFVWENWRKQ